MAHIEKATLLQAAFLFVGVTQFLIIKVLLCRESNDMALTKDLVLINLLYGALITRLAEFVTLSEAALTLAEAILTLAKAALLFLLIGFLLRVRLSENVALAEATLALDACLIVFVASLTKYIALAEATPIGLLFIINVFLGCLAELVALAEAALILAEATLTLTKAALLCWLVNDILAAGLRLAHRVPRSKTALDIEVSRLLLVLETLCSFFDFKDVVIVVIFQALC